MTPSGTLVRTVELLLWNRQFRVRMGDDVSLAQAGEWTSSGLCCGSHSLYTNDLPATLSRRFIYADDIYCDFQVETFSEIECTLTADLAHLAKYYQQWRLKPKNVTSIFHLCT